MHQPLHLSGKARGGNDVYVHFDGYKTNLHKVWDGLGLMKRMKAVSKDRNQHGLAREESLLVIDGQDGEGEYGISEEDSVHELMSGYHWYINGLMQGEYFGSLSRKWTMCPHSSVEPRFGCPEDWAKEIARLNCEYTWLDVVENGTLGEEYWRRIEDDMIFEILVMKAATRLAAVLNSVAEYRDEHHLAL
ncbi:protein of unknown function [Taphrina deformans PYCC 5710]|uniref:Uncharacterized protein n=1 Tax=Taphrina deformans (strain PYCC 5710 / ATCC 11124 / CBS 356.35 / IMI 108563 / JCM 9778 / NBRC 8474) TaxID=1097556 RepID=R4XE60_TAPDE|nr:protein of unknown function [Taphrina deformans PYCC 5710]|eukprot:CCG82730.1 protein of unknown function [Taphrina deformans PYCC 5710]